MKKRLLLLLCMIACVFSLVACSSDKEKTSSKKSLQYDEETLHSEIEGIINSFTAMSKDEAEKNLEDVEEGTLDYQILSAWTSNCDDLGSLKSIDKYSFSSDEKTITCEIDTTFSKRTAKMTFLITAEDTTFRIEPKYTLGEKMQKACLNTLLGMGTVFIVLILIAFPISLFKYINKLEQASKNKDASATATAVDQTIAQIVEKEENLTDDLELVAVITAAIAASEGTSTDGLYVRSIKRVNKSKWQRA